MDQAELTAKPRTVFGKQVKQLRRDGWVPGVVYGHGFESLPVQFEERPLSRLLSHVGGSQLVQVSIEGIEQPESALVRDVQRDCLTRALLHVDLYRVSMTERLRAEVPLVLVGEPPVAESRQGMLLQGISSVEVDCLPADLVDSIEVDLSTLMELDVALLVRDLPVPPGITILTDGDETVANVVYMAEEEEEIEEEEAILPISPEVEVITEARGEPGEQEL
jgi:large subunit ribosomal protein L25